MNELAIQENMDKLIDVISQIKTSGKDNEGLLNVSNFANDLKDILNKIFQEDGYLCTDIFPQPQ